MIKPMVVALAAGQVLTVPAQAAELGGRGPAAEMERGTFAGARLRVPLGARRGEAARAGLTLAPTMHDGQGHIALGEGLDFGVAGRDGPALRVAGRRLDAEPAGERAGVSTLGAVAIGAGVLAVGFAVWFVHELNEASE